MRKPSPTAPPFRVLAPSPIRPDSNTSTSAPAFAALMAADIPAYPDPTMATSHVAGRGGFSSRRRGVASHQYGVDNGGLAFKSVKSFPIPFFQIVCRGGR